MTFPLDVDQDGIAFDAHRKTDERDVRWVDAGAAGFGIGSNIYKQGATAANVAKAAKEFVTAWRTLKS